MLKKLAEYISEYYNWLDVYCAMVVFEYDRIMKIMFVKNCSKFNLPDDIEKCWQAHILDTEFYSQYCMENFGKIIHYKPLKLIDNKKNKDIKPILGFYQEKHNFPKYEIVWKINNFCTEIRHHLISNIKLNLFKISGKYITAYHYSPNASDTFQTVIDILSSRYYVENKDIKMYINVNDVTEFNLKQICTEFKLNETYEISHRYNIVSFLNNHIKSYNIIFATLV
jgi:hypothetical protein